MQRPLHEFFAGLAGVRPQGAKPRADEPLAIERLALTFAAAQLWPYGFNLNGRDSADSIRDDAAIIDRGELATFCAAARDALPRPAPVFDALASAIDSHARLAHRTAGRGPDAELRMRADSAALQGALAKILHNGADMARMVHSLRYYMRAGNAEKLSHALPRLVRRALVDKFRVWPAETIGCYPSSMTNKLQDLFGLIRPKPRDAAESAKWRRAIEFSQDGDAWLAPAYAGPLPPVGETMCVKDASIRHGSDLDRQANIIRDGGPAGMVAFNLVADGLANGIDPIKTDRLIFLCQEDQLPVAYDALPSLRRKWRNVYIVALNGAYAELLTFNSGAIILGQPTGLWPFIRAFEGLPPGFRSGDAMREADKKAARA